MNRFIKALFLTVLPLTLCSSSMDGGVWIDGDTFRISGTGLAGSEISVVKRKASACEAARLDAAAKMIMKFAETGIESVRGKVKTETFRHVVKKEFSGTIRGADIVKSTYDSASGKCVVIYQLVEKDMRRKIIRLARKHGR